MFDNIKRYISLIYIQFQQFIKSNLKLCIRLGRSLFLYSSAIHCPICIAPAKKPQIVLTGQIPINKYESLLYDKRENKIVWVKITF